MDAIIRRSNPLAGELVIPSDKSIAHRAVLLSAVAAGQTVITPWPQSEDCQRTLQLVRDLGVETAPSGAGVRVTGRGEAGLAAPANDLDCGESGTTLRLAAGLLAGQPFTSRLTAAPSLSRRPMRRITGPLGQMGALFDGAPGPGGELLPPLQIQGKRPLKAIRYELPVPSAQVKSAVLLAGLAADGPTTVVEPQATRDHTERMLAMFGAKLDKQGPEITLTPGPLKSPGTVRVPGDPSSAAFFLVAAITVPGSSLLLRDVSFNPTRTRLFDLLTQMGARLDMALSGMGAEPLGTITASARPLQPVQVGPADVPALIDELPILMVAAAAAPGVSRFSGLAELRVKETDRIASMVSGLRAMGAEVREPAPDTVEIEGGKPLRGARVDGAGDHRTVMSLAVAGLTADGSTTIRGAEAVAKSFPEFFRFLAQVTGSPSVKGVDKT